MGAGTDARCCDGTPALAVAAATLAFIASILARAASAGDWIGAWLGAVSRALAASARARASAMTFAMSGLFIAEPFVAAAGEALLDLGRLLPFWKPLSSSGWGRFSTIMSKG